MTIFDTIRNPNPDITNNEELKLIPRDILERWIPVCLEEIDEVFPGELNLKNPRNDFAIIVDIMLCTQVSTYESWETKEIKKGLWKHRFTAILKKMIAEYDPE